MGGGICQVYTGLMYGMVYTPAAIDEEDFRWNPEAEPLPMPLPALGPGRPPDAGRPGEGIVYREFGGRRSDAPNPCPDGLPERRSYLSGGSRACKSSMRSSKIEYKCDAFVTVLYRL